MLILFDLDGTIVSSYMDRADKNYHSWELLPGRAEKIAKLRAAGHIIGIVTNQGGVAFGLVTEDDFIRKIGQVAQQLGIGSIDLYDGRPDGPLGLGWGHDLPAFVCYSDSRAKDKRYHVDAYRRKPSGQMIREAIAVHPAAARDGVVFVGDRPEDQQAAADAGVAFRWAEEFFT